MDENQSVMNTLLSVLDNKITDFAVTVIELDTIQVSYVGAGFVIFLVYKKTDTITPVGLYSMDFSSNKQLNFVIDDDIRKSMMKIIADNARIKDYMEDAREKHRKDLIAQSDKAKEYYRKLRP
jgi:hypothetical protein